jgi:zinc protease
MYRALLGGALALLAAVTPAAAEDPIPAGTVVAPDPGLRSGKLANGLRYAIMSNSTPDGAISIRLAFGVGSYEEADDELGYAHFLEHMAFRSTKQAPDGVLDGRFGTLRVALGRDQNAQTALESTIYSVDLPRGGVAAARTVLEWMRGAADGILLTADTVGAERGVVLSELRERRSALTELQQKIARFQMPGARSVNRDPGGTDESVRAATPERLRAFHDRWYRPDNATLVIVGSAPEADLLKAAEEAFGSWRSDGPAPTPPVPSRLPADRGLDAISLAEPSAPQAVSACRIGPPDARDHSVERERRLTYSTLWTSILNSRLQRRSLESGSPSLGGLALVNRDTAEGVIACLVVVPNQGRWKEAFADGESELRRFAAEGPTSHEVEVAIEAIRGPLRGSAYQAATRSTPELADKVAQASLRNVPFAHPDEAMRLAELLTAGITADDVKASFARDWTGSGPLLSLVSAAPVAREDVLAVWTAGEKAAPLAAYADRAGGEWLYTDFGKAGRSAGKQTFHDPEFVRYRFRNGTIFNFRQTALESGGVDIRVRFGNGERELDAASRVPASLAAGLLPAGGLGKMDYAEIEAALASTTWQFSLAVQPTAYVLSTSTLSDQVPQQLRLLAAYMTDPGFRPAMDEKLPTVIDWIYRLFETDPATVAEGALEKALFPNQMSFPPREALAGLRARDFERLLRPKLTQQPAEVTIVGDMTEKEAKRAVAATFGALPPRPALVAPAGDGPFRRFPETLPKEALAYHSGPREKAAAMLVWPLYVALPERRREEFALNLLAAIFQTRLLQQVRGTMGKAYSPQVIVPMPDYSDQGYLAAKFETKVADLDQVVAATRAVAAEMVAGRITQDEVDRARGPMIAAREQFQQRNGAWAGAISAATRDPRALRELLGYTRDMGEVTLEDVKSAAAAWLAREPVVARALPRPAEPAAAPH